MTRDPAGSESATGAGDSSSAESNTPASEDGQAPDGDPSPQAPGDGSQSTSAEGSGSGWESVRPPSQWPRSRLYRVAARGVLILAILCSAMGASIVAACFVDDFNINQAPGQGAAEVINTTSPLRTVVRFSTADGRVHLPASGILYPQGLRKGQTVLIEYDARNPDLARVQGRNGWLAVQPVVTSLALVWAGLLTARWLLLRTSGRHAAAESRRRT